LAPVTRCDKKNIPHLVVRMNVKIVMVEFKNQGGAEQYLWHVFNYMLSIITLLHKNISKHVTSLISTGRIRCAIPSTLGFRGLQSWNNNNHGVYVCREKNHT